MAPTRRRYLAMAGSAIALAGCQGTSNDAATPTDDSGGSSGTTSGGGGGPGAAVQVREHADFGSILVDAEGLSLYMFDSDTQGSGESTCSGGCLQAWPALTVEGEATAGDGVDAQLTTFERGDGTTQVAANGWPLYYYASDSSPGDVTGQGVNDVWWVLDPAGEPIRSSGATTTSTESGGSGVGY